MIAARLLVAHGALQELGALEDLRSLVVGLEAQLKSARARIVELEAELDPHANPQRRILVSRFSGECPECGGTYERGDRIGWARGVASVHAGCVRSSEAA